jgi:dTDP-4-dehydrorhamnose reductase
MMGGGPGKDKKFVQKIMKQIKLGCKTLNVVNDKDGTPTYTHDFAANVKTLLEQQCWGLYNMVCDGVTSRLEVAKELIEILGLSEAITINEVDSGFFSKEYFADRPPSERLVNRKLQLRDLDTMQDWKVALRAYIERDYKNYLDDL